MAALTYRVLFRLICRWLDAESAHHAAARTLAALTRIAPLRALLARLLAPRDPRLRVRALGLEFPSPLGVPAGVDKDATWFDGLAALGFGFVEVGTATALAQPGNPRPRVHRLPADRALANRMGFPNAGAGAIAARLARRRPGGPPVGANIGRTKAAGDAAADYAASARALAPVADFLVVNVSSPNTPGLRAMQAVEQLEPLLVAVQRELAASGRPVPLLVKIAPDLADEDVDAVADLALRLGLDGIVAVNTTIAAPGAQRDGTPWPAVGGVSGAPLKPRALAVLRRLRARVGDQLVLVAVGGIETADDAWERIEAGATLVQAYTGFVYGGPLWPRRVNRDLARRVAASGRSSIQEAVGAAAVAPAAAAAP